MTRGVSFGSALRARGGARRGYAMFICLAALLAANSALLVPSAALGQETGERVVSFSAGKAPKGLAELQALEERLQQLNTEILPSVVNVRVGAAQGSGVIISKDGYVLTAGHVCIEPGRNVVFTLSDGRQVRGKSLGMNVELDSGLMKITQGGDYPALEMGDSDNLKPGQWVVATGHPGGYYPDRQAVLRLGRVLSRSNDVIGTDCTLVGGDSGGPLLDLEGKVIGINSRIGGPLTINLHVPVNRFRQQWDRLAASEKFGEPGEQRPFIGVRGQSDAERAVISHVFQGSPAEAAGIEVGDVIVEFAGEPVSDFASLAALVSDTSPGDTVRVIVQRRGAEETQPQQRELRLTVGAARG